MSRRLRAGARAATTAAARLLFPPNCFGCRALLAEPGALCAACWRSLSFIERPFCEVLGAPFSADAPAGTVSPEAIARPPAFGRARAALVYRGVAARMAQSLKYSDRTDLAPVMAAWMRRAGAELLSQAEVVVPVPLHRLRFWRRRFNQSAELGRFVASQAGLPFDPGLVRRVRPTRQQVGLSRSERERNLRGAFVVPPSGAPRLANRRVLLIDDVLTTGSTANAVAKALKRAGAAEVDVLAFAMALPGRGDEAQGDFWPADDRPI